MQPNFLSISPKIGDSGDLMSHYYLRRAASIQLHKTFWVFPPPNFWWDRAYRAGQMCTFRRVPFDVYEFAVSPSVTAKLIWVCSPFPTEAGPHGLWCCCSNADSRTATSSTIALQLVWWEFTLLLTEQSHSPASWRYATSSSFEQSAFVPSLFSAQQLPWASGTSPLGRGSPIFWSVAFPSRLPTDAIEMLSFALSLLFVPIIPQPPSKIAEVSSSLDYLAVLQAE